MRASTYGTIATTYVPRCAGGHAVIVACMAGCLTRRRLAEDIRDIRSVEGGFAARHCLAWLDAVGDYPTKGGAR